MNRRHLVAIALADAFLAGPPVIEGLAERAAWCLGRKHRWIAPLCKRAFQRFGSSLAPSDRRKLIGWIEEDRGFEAAWDAYRVPRIQHYFLDPPPMAPRTGALASCDLPAIPTPGDLARWLGIGISEMDWFADLRRMNPAEGPLSHYRYVWVTKRYGARLMEVPKARLRQLQRKILRGILDRVPVHAAAHGFRQGRSCRSFVAPHVGREVVLRMDLRDFFPSIPVARILAGLCTNGVRHLPQGAPTSPSLANLCALHLDLRLDALAESVNGRYTRYADDIAISGDEVLRRRVSRVSGLVSRIAIEEQFAVNHRKTRAMHRSHRQLLTGIVVNEKANVRRPDFDRLKAILTNCARYGPDSQNRERRMDFRGHLEGRVAHVASLNPSRATKLQAILATIDWNA